VNGDGCDDVSWCDYGGKPQVWLWSPTGPWVEATNGLPASGPAEATQLCDMNGDGRLDIVLFGGGIVAVYLGDGAGNWSPATLFTTGTPGYAVALETGDDVDRNGRADITLLSEEGTWLNRRNHLRFYREASTPARLLVQLVRPGPYRVLKRGSVRFVEWRSAVPGGVPSAIALELSTTGPVGPWTPIAAGLPDNGRYQWTVPPTTPQSTACHLRVTLTTASDTSSRVNARPFTID